MDTRHHRILNNPTDKSLIPGFIRYSLFVMRYSLFFITDNKQQTTNNKQQVINTI